MSCAAAILAGGGATRLGGAFKPLLIVGGRTILARQLAVLTPLVDEVLLVTGDGNFPGTPPPGVSRLVGDLRPGEGPLAGLEAALSATTADALLLVGGDMPALHPAALRLLRDADPAAAAVVPSVDGRHQVLHARYARRLLPLVRSRLDRGRRALVGLLDEAPDTLLLDEAALRAADPTLLTLASANSADDLARLERALSAWPGC